MSVVHICTSKIESYRARSLTHPPCQARLRVLGVAPLSGLRALAALQLRLLVQVQVLHPVGVVVHVTVAKDGHLPEARR
jgi:hypothetical protein